MSMTEDEYAYDEYMTQMYEEHKNEAIEEFASERLKSYYAENKLLAEPAFRALSESRNLTDVNPTAGFVFAAIAIEVGLKETLLKPIVSGLVHTASVASLVTNLVVSHQGMDKYRELLLQTLREHGGVNLDTYKRSNSKTLIWQEIREVQKKRNLIVHKAESGSIEEASLALGVAGTIVEELFPKVVQEMGLHLHEGFRICNDWKCEYEATPTGEILKKLKQCLG
jgi:hypothetical protein